MAVDDQGTTFTLSPDPLLETVKVYTDQLVLGDNIDMESIISPVLHMEQVFGVDLYEAGLAGTVLSYLEELTTGIGAVRNTLKKHLGEGNA